MALHPCALLRSCALPAERFGSVHQLAARIHAIRGARPVYMRRMALSPVGEAVSIRWADDPTGPALGYAVIGDPPRPGAVQYNLLGMALARLCPVVHENADFVEDPLGLITRDQHTGNTVGLRPDWRRFQPRGFA